MLSTNSRNCCSFDLFSISPSICFLPRNAHRQLQTLPDSNSDQPYHLQHFPPSLLRLYLYFVSFLFFHSFLCRHLLSPSISSWCVSSIGIVCSICASAAACSFCGSVTTFSRGLFHRYEFYFIIYCCVSVHCAILVSERIVTMTFVWRKSMYAAL